MLKAHFSFSLLKIVENHDTFESFLMSRKVYWNWYIFFNVTYDQFSASLLNKSIKLFIHGAFWW